MFGQARTHLGAELRANLNTPNDNRNFRFARIRKDVECSPANANRSCRRPNPQIYLSCLRRGEAHNAACQLNNSFHILGVWIVDKVIEQHFRPFAHRHSHFIVELQCRGTVTTCTNFLIVNQLLARVHAFG